MSRPEMVLIDYDFKSYIAQVLDIERQSFPDCWTEQDFLRCLYQNRCGGMVARYDKNVLGYMIYHVGLEEYHIANLAVHPEFRRIGVASTMVKQLSVITGIINPSPVITMMLREGNVVAQVFLRSVGFLHAKTLRDYYDDSEEDAYILVFRQPWTPSEKNRIFEYLDE